MSVNEVSDWSEFAVALAGVEAVLAGLIFIGLSANLTRILSTPGLAGRAGESIIMFIAAVLQCAFLLLPHQGVAALGIELLALALVESSVLLALSVRGLRVPSRQPWHWHATRFVAGQSTAVPAAVSGLLLVIGTPGALFWFAAGVLWAVPVGTANAWVLVVEVVRDDRYRPLDSGGSFGGQVDSSES